MNDFLIALTVTVLSSTAGLAVAAVVPAVDFLHDPRLLAPICTLGVNAIWLAWRIYRRHQHRRYKVSQQQEEWAAQEARYLLRIQKLEAEVTHLHRLDSRRTKPQK